MDGVGKKPNPSNFTNETDRFPYPGLVGNRCRKLFSRNGPFPQPSLQLQQHTAALSQLISPGVKEPSRARGKIIVVGTVMQTPRVKDARQERMSGERK